MDEKAQQREAIKLLPPRIHLNEFLVRYPNFSEMERAGFKTYAKKEWMRLSEWQELLDKYINR
jgi:hypothetical protein